MGRQERSLSKSTTITRLGVGLWAAGWLLATLPLSPASAQQLAGLLPNGEQTFVDANGQPYSGGSVYFYLPSTTTPKTTWVDPGEVVPNANPVVLDTAGRAIIYGAGQYREILKDQWGNTIWDQLTYGQGQATTGNSYRTTSGSFTIPAASSSSSFFKFTVFGGGGGGGAGGTTAGGAGGGGQGAGCVYTVSGLTGSSTVTVTIGAGGTVGNSGGTSSIVVGATTVTGTGGGAGIQTGNIVGGVGGAGGTCTNATYSVGGQAGSDGTTGVVDVTTGFGGSGGGPGGARGANGVSDAPAATAPGAGGGGGSSGGGGQNGSAGIAGSALMEYSL